MNMEYFLQICRFVLYVLPMEDDYSQFLDLDISSIFSRPLPENYAHLKKKRSKLEAVLNSWQIFENLLWQITYMEKVVKCPQARLFWLKNVHTFHKKCPQFLAREKKKFTFYYNNSHITHMWIFLEKIPIRDIYA